MASCITCPSSFFNRRAYGQKKAWKTYYDSQETAAAEAAADSNELNEDLEGVSDGSSTRQGKRGREGGNLEVGGRVLGPHDHRLTETFGRSPTDAVLIAVPKYDDDWRPDPRGDMGGGHRGGIRPTNTLRKSAPQAASNFFSHFVTHGPTTLSTQTLRGDNVRKVEEVFEEHEAGEPRSKRRRMDPPGKPSKQKLSQTVDLTEDGDDSVFNGTPRCKTACDNPFAMGESAKADSFITTKSKQSNPTKSNVNRQRRSGSQQSSIQGSAQSPAPMQDQASYVETMAGTRNSPMVIDERSNVKRRSSMQGSRQWIPINLEKDLPTTQVQPRKSQTKAARGSQQDPNNTNSMPMSSARPTNEPPRHAQRAQKEDRRGDAGDLRHKFVRESHARQPKVKDKMRVESTIFVRDEGSPDQLTGARNVVAHVPPHKVSGRRPQSSAKTNEMKQVRISHSDASEHVQPRVLSPPSEPDTEDISAEEHIPIRSIFSKQCIEEQEGLALEWNAEGNHFFVVCGDEKVRLPKQKAPVTIGKADVNICWQHSPDIPKAMLKGSSTSVSNGITIIEFEDMDGLNACYNVLLHATEDHMKSTSVSAKHMENAFVKQCNELREAHNRMWQTLNADTTNLLGDRRAGWQAVQSQSENEIQYESHSATLSEVLAEAQNHSKYFQQENTRRSTRQVKRTVTKSRSPSPPRRWSYENTVPAWQHPVVFPSQGARRVTVYDSDVVRLDEGEYLNDNLLGFAIRHIEETMDSAHKDKVHFFNTFFYSTLMKKNKREPDYEAVKRWTKSVDIFSIPYTVVPINNDLHWYFAIICNLSFLSRKLCGTEDEEQDHSASGFTDDTSGIIDIDREFSTELLPRSTAQSEAMADDSIDEVFVFRDDGTVARTEGISAFNRPCAEAGKKTKKAKQRATPPTRKYDVDAPVVIMLDSFGHARSTESRALKLYIQAEAKEKRQMHVETGEIQGLNAKGLPAQPNFCDCGVFVIGYLMEFAKDPDAFVKKILRREMDPEKDFKGFSAPNIRNSIRATLFQVAEEQAEERRAQKAEKRARAAQRSTPTKASKQSSPVPQPPSAQETSNATMRAAPPPAPPHVKSVRSSLVLTSQTAPRSSFDQAAAHGKAAGVLEFEDELEVSAPTALAQTGNASPASFLNPDTDEEMLDVPTSEQGHESEMPPDSHSQYLVPSRGSQLKASTSNRASCTESTSSHEGRPAEIEDSQGLGYD